LSPINSHRRRYKWIVSQIGARQHYGVPRGFQAKDSLRLLYTEFWCRWGSDHLKNGPKWLRAFAGRYHPHVPNSRVVSFNLRSSIDRLAHAKGNSIEEISMEFARFGQWFSESVNRHLFRQQLDPERDCFFGFDTGCLETMLRLKERGIVTVCDQIDPGRVEEEIVYQETLKWPGWQEAPGRIPNDYFKRLEQEWKVADLILVNSDWSKEALVQQGVPAEKQFVVPVAYEPEVIYAKPRTKRPGALQVLWLGTVNLRKGIQYLIESAKMLQNEDVKFIIAGPIDISKDAVASAPKNMEFIGRVNRVQTAEVYKAADVFVLPTLSDGFAITQVEAMGYGLPVIATPNCAEVVTRGVDGFIVPARDARALADAILSLRRDPALLQEMSRNALSKVCNFRLPMQADQVEQEVTRFLAGDRRRIAAKLDVFQQPAQAGLLNDVTP